MNYLTRIKSFLRASRGNGTEPPPLRPHVRPGLSFRPSFADLHVARAMLQTKLPTELVLHILEFAQYWPCQVFTMERECQVYASSWSSFGKICFDVEVLPESGLRSFREENVKVKAVEFHITSYEHGWTQGPYSTSSWLEVSILRKENPRAQSLPDQSTVSRPLISNSQPLQELFQDPQDDGHGWIVVERPALAAHYPQADEDARAWYLQGNKVADRRPRTHTVLWSVFSDECKGNEGAGSGQGFLDELRAGDRLVVWARAKWAGWTCYVSELEITISYGV
ncbi:uncharacterized protein EI97DRAFT_203714 [Westerdykella ornata]|uniref:Uncharacterized protein n=1 Tax=Westerdykella ornata TaxID=318751 RepID=A0A6A6J988_WESOR|nr:uncharacterized protein EI97DRAFT_203714 [Westerdykella ornata]KAF2272538.1 hypothetical protein EI97DRAFT_203714 [Westerdykella ornata]